MTKNAAQVKNALTISIAERAGEPVDNYTDTIKACLRIRQIAPSNRNQRQHPPLILNTSNAVKTPPKMGLTRVIPILIPTRKQKR